MYAKIELFNKLFTAAENEISTEIEFEVISEDQLNKAKKVLEMLIESQDGDNIGKFNEQLLYLLDYIPRKPAALANLFARKTEDFKGIINREKEYLESLELLLDKGECKDDDKEIFPDIVVSYPTAEEIDFVTRFIKSNKKKTAKAIYKIKNLATTERFKQYCDNNTVKKTYLWHGSGGQNWLSIIKNGLVETVQGVEKSFDRCKGIYLSENFDYSYGFSNNQRNHSETKFIGLYSAADSRESLIRGDMHIYNTPAAVNINYIIEI